MGDAVLMQGDCLELLPLVPDGSIDMVLCDLPYGTTQNKWDSVLPLDRLWAEYWRVVKSNGAVVLTAQTPFDKVLGVSCLRHLKYEWIWQKEMGTGHLNAKKQPMKFHENVLVFYRAQCTYNPQFEVGTPYSQKSGRGSTNYGEQERIVTESDGRRYPKSVQVIARDRGGVHPTQKPVALMEYLIRTYTNPGDTVLDNTMGSGTTGVAAANTGRRFIGMEMDAGYFEIAAERIANASPANDNVRPAVAPQQPAAVVAANDNAPDLFSETSNGPDYSFPHE